MKILFIGGTGTISTAISKLIIQSGWELYLLNRGNRKSAMDGMFFNHIECDIRTQDYTIIREKLINTLANSGQKQFDVVVDFIGYFTEHVEKDFNIFNGLCKQFIFISSASVYQKPLSSYIITESTPLANPFSQYSRDKIACENFLMDKYRDSGFPVTIVRPSHTYDNRKIPVAFHGKKGSWPVIKRMLEGKPVIIHGDGSSLWTLTHHSDFARGFVRLMGNIHAIGESVHITSDESLTWNQIFYIIANALNVELKAVYAASDFLAECAIGLYDFRAALHGDKANTVVFDNSKLKYLAPGFCANFRFDEGIKQCAASVLANKEFQQEDPEFEAWYEHVITKIPKSF
ncbi:MAG: NAD-dependent epimerase/dehydratase family protein [Treponema sp.]|nr:NAD-dependent epimerase/dehydratase family protein [Treponema sp.]